LYWQTDEQHHDQEKDYLKLGTDLLKKESIGGIKLDLNIKIVESIIGFPSEKTERPGCINF